jgi:hypothetical protein
VATITTGQLLIIEVGIFFAVVAILVYFGRR